MTVLATDPSSPTSHPAFVDFARIVDEVIAPAAVGVDATEVPQSHIEALGATGFWGWTIPAEHGGTPVPPGVQSAALELLFGACPSTGLIASQHFGPIQHILRIGTPELLALLPDLATGARIGAGAFGHVRSWPARRTVTATRVDGGYRFDGEITWMSGWGVVNLPWAGAIDEEHSEVVHALIDLPAPEARPRPLQLAAIQGSRTVAVHLVGLFVPSERVVLVQDVDGWKAQDGSTGPVASPPGSTGLPGPVGLARAALADARLRFPDDTALARLADEIDTVHERVDTGPHGRALVAELAVRATTAALVARGGAGLVVDDIAQVRARAALFLQVRGLSPEVRAAEFERLAR